MNHVLYLFPVALVSISSRLKLRDFSRKEDHVQTPDLCPHLQETSGKDKEEICLKGLGKFRSAKHGSVVLVQGGAAYIL